MLKKQQSKIFDHLVFCGAVFISVILGFVLADFLIGPNRIDFGQYELSVRTMPRSELHIDREVVDYPFNLVNKWKGEAVLTLEGGEAEIWILNDEAKCVYFHCDLSSGYSPRYRIISNYPEEKIILESQHVEGYYLRLLLFSAGITLLVAFFLVLRFFRAKFFGKK